MSEKQTSNSESILCSFNIYPILIKMHKTYIKILKHIASSLTALNRSRRYLQRKDFSTRLRDVHTKYQSYSSILSANISFSFSKFYIWISKFQNTCTVNTRKKYILISLFKNCSEQLKCIIMYWICQVLCTYNPSIWEGEKQEISSYRSALATQWAQDQNGLQETLSQSQTKIFQKEFCNPNLIKNKYLR